MELERWREEGGWPQDLAVDLIDPAREPEFRFFRNPAYEPDAQGRFQMVQEQALRSFLIHERERTSHGRLVVVVQLTTVRCAQRRGG